PVNPPNTANVAAPALATARADGVNELKAADIRPDAPLGENQYIERGGMRIPLGGGRGETGTFNVTASQWDPAHGYSAVGNGPGSNSSSYLHVVAFNDTRCPDARTLVAYSQSSDPLSPHHADQTALLSRKQWVTER